MKNKKLIIIGAVAAIVIALGIIFVPKLFSKSTNEPEENGGKKEVEPTITPTPKPDIKIIDLNSNTRPYAIMINCKSEALPQAGVQDAYLVYELMVEGGITRMMALFKDKELSKVGSVRSSRNQYLGYVLENDAIYAHAGGSPESLDRIANEKFDDIDVDGQYGVRDKELAKKRAWEHTLFTNSTLLDKGAKAKGLRTTSDKKPVLTYSAEEVDLSKYQTETANKVSIKYSSYRTAIYEYDKENKHYLRFMNKTKNSDLITGEQYHVKNILVYGVHYTQYTDHGNPSYVRPENIGKGEGYYITNGVALPITWEKAKESSQTIYKVKETGEELVVNDGNTYIQVYPTNGGKLTIE